MAAIKKGLGRGLDALFESYREETEQFKEEALKVQEIKIIDIDPNQISQERSLMKKDE